MNVYELYICETNRFFKYAVLEKGKPFKVCFGMSGHNKYKGVLFLKEVFVEDSRSIPIDLQPYFGSAKLTKDLIKEGKKRVVYIDENTSAKIYKEHNIEDFCQLGKGYFDRIENVPATDEIYQQIAQEGKSNNSFEVYIKYDSVVIAYEGRQRNKTIKFEDFNMAPLQNINLMAALTNSILKRLSIVGIDGMCKPIDYNHESYTKPSYFGKTYGAKQSGYFADNNKFAYKSHRCNVTSFHNNTGIQNGNVNNTYVYIYIEQTNEIIGALKEEKKLTSW